MHFRQARPAQRLVPDSATMLNLPNPFHVAVIIQGAQSPGSSSYSTANRQLPEDAGERCRRESDRDARRHLQ
jgi:hypothetical protein